MNAVAHEKQALHRLLRSMVWRSTLLILTPVEPILAAVLTVQAGVLWPGGTDVSPMLASNLELLMPLSWWAVVVGCVGAVQLGGILSTLVGGRPHHTLRKTCLWATAVYYVLVLVALVRGADFQISFGQPMYAAAASLSIINLFYADLASRWTGR